MQSPLKRIEFRIPEEYNPNCRRIQFYLQAPHHTLLVLEQTDNPKDKTVLSGRELLRRSKQKNLSILHAYIVGITLDEELFVFEPYQDLFQITKDAVFVFKNAVLKEDPICGSSSDKS